jgi:hypothetical protein
MQAVISFLFSTFVFFSIPSIAMEGQKAAIDPETREIYNKIKQLLLAAPDVLLMSKNSAFFEKHKTEFEKLHEMNKNESFMAHKELLARMEQEWPLALLSECNKKQCLFNRAREPYFRNFFEDDVSQRLCKKIEADPSRTIHYVSFGCLHGFPDLIILTKTLSQNPEASIVFHGIDKKHSRYIELRDQLGKGREITLNYCAYDDFADDESKISCLHLEALYKQLLGCLSITFPQAKLSVIIQDRVDSFFDYIEQHNLPYPDIVSASDIEHKNLEGQGTADYKKLCRKTLEKNPSCENIWLAKGKHKGEAVIKTIFLAKGENKEEDVEMISIALESQAVQLRRELTAKSSPSRFCAVS